MSPWILLGYGWLGAGLVMVLIWAIQRRTNDAGIVDVVWAALIGVLSIFFAFSIGGYFARRLLIAALASIWALRLAGYLLIRVTRMPEDGRYRRLRQAWGDDAQKYLFWFFQIQASWALLFAAPMLIASRNTESPLGVLDAVGVVIWATSILGELIADRQLHRFRTNPASKGRVCSAGLWRYSRHPNYFFEWLHWWAYVAIGWHAPFGWLTLIGPVAMLLFLFKVTGIPPTERNALASRGEAYRQYQRTTSVFFPWPPAKANGATT